MSAPGMYMSLCGTTPSNKMGRRLVRRAMTCGSVSSMFWLMSTNSAKAGARLRRSSPNVDESLCFPAKVSISADGFRAPRITAMVAPALTPTIFFGRPAAS